MGSQCVNKESQDLAYSVRESFSHKISMPVINESDKESVMQNWTVFMHV